MTTSCKHESGTQTNSGFTPRVATNGREVVVNGEPHHHGQPVRDLGQPTAPQCDADELVVHA